MRKLCLLKEICNALSVVEHEFRGRHGIKLIEALALCSLQSGRLSSGEIADKIGESYSNTSKIISSMERMNFIKRVMGSDDKRQMYFSLTELGEKAIAEIESADIKFGAPLDDIIHRL